jgi:Replication-relaxation
MTGIRTSTDRMIVQPRDREFLRELAILRVADREQVKLVAGFKSTTRVNTRLLKLTRAGLLRRFFLGSGGGRKALYALSEKGARLIDAPMRGPRRPQGAMLVADLFVEHQLAINSIYCAVRFGKSAG